MLKRAAQYALLSVVAISGLVLALRMLIGPFTVPIPVHTPLNPEGWFGVSLTAILAIRDRGTDSREQSQQRRFVWWTAAIIAALIGLTAVAFRRALNLYFLSDDFILVKLANAFQFAMLPLFATGGGDGFFRPIGNISLALTAMWAGVNPLAWHAAALALHMANVVLVFMLATRLNLSRLAAFFAAALFCIHGTRPEAVAWIAGRFDLVATFFVLAGLLLFVDFYHEISPKGFVCVATALVCMVLAILSKESVYIFPLLLLLFLIAKRDLARSRIVVLIPFFVTAAALFLYRWWLFGAIGGYNDAHTGRSQALTFGLSTIKALVLRLWMALYFPINWSMEPGAVLAVLMIAYIGALVWLATSRPNATLMTFTLGFVIVSALPPLHLLVIGAGLWNSRLLYLPSVGFCFMLAVAMDGLKGRERWIVSSIILAFSFAALQHNLNAWDYASVKARATSAVARNCVPAGPDNILLTDVPGSLRGVPFFANGLSEAIELQRNSAPVAITIRGADGRPDSPSLVWNPVKETAECVPGKPR